MKLLDLFERKSTKTDATAWVILYTKDKLILGKRAPGTNNSNQWNFFGGHIDIGETDAAQAACRELAEETGLRLNPASLKHVATIGNAIYFAVKVDSAGGMGTTDEISQIKKFKLTDLPNNLHNKTQNFFTNLEALFQS